MKKTYTKQALHGVSMQNGSKGSESQIIGPAIEIMPRKFKQVAKLPVRNYSEANALLPKVKALLGSLDLIIARDFRVLSIRGDQLYMTIELTDEADEAGATSMLLLMLNAEQERMYDSVRR